MPIEPANPSPAAVNYDARLTALFSALAAVGVLTLSTLFTPGVLPKFDICMLHRITGIPCPGCGLTRAFCAISHGNFTAAWHFNPFGFLFYAGFLAVPFWAAWKWRNPARRMLSERNRNKVWTAMLFICLAMIAHDIWRICHGWR